MKAKEYLLDIGFDDAHLPESFNNDDKSYYQITELMEKYHQAKLKLLGVGVVSNCECKNLPEGEIAISSKALTDPNWKG